MNKHDRLVRSIAEEMADERIRRINSILPLKRGPVIDQYMPIARIAVKHMAYEARTVWMALSQKTWEQAHEECEKYLTAIGLIPPTEKEVSDEQ